MSGPRVEVSVDGLGYLLSLVCGGGALAPKPEEVCRWEDDGGPVRALDDGYTHSFTAIEHEIAEDASPWWITGVRVLSGEKVHPSVHQGPPSSSW